MNELNLYYPYQYVDRTYCFSVFETMHIQTIPWDNEKGYIFMSCPCYCYASLCKDIHDDFSEFKEDPIDLLISDKRLKFLNQIVRSNYSYCKNCPKYQLKDTTGFWRDYDFKYFFGEEYGSTIVNSYKNKYLKTILPYSIGFNLDDCCNLACPTCRSKIIGHKYGISNSDQEQLVYLAKKVKSISIGGNGEFFMSHNYDKLLNADLTENSNLESIILYTNGTLFNERHWERINVNSRKLIKEIKISIDAASEETYKKVRGNHWNTLLKNIEFIKTLKEQYGFKLHTTFTISKYNVSDVYAFYEFAKSLGFDTVMFSFAREIFHPETGDNTDFIIPLDARSDIMDFLKNLQQAEGYEKVSVE